MKRIPKFLFHFWIVVSLFLVIGILCKNIDIPKTINEFLGNIFLYRLSYNGAWWFVLTYIFLVLTYPMIRWISEKS